MNIKKYLFLPFFFIVFTLYSQSVDTLANHNLESSSLTDSIAEVPIDSLQLQHYPYEWISYRAKTQFVTKEAHDVVQIYIVNRVDSIIYFNASTSGVELARLVVTPKKATFVNKMQKSYFEGSHELLSIIFNFPVDFDILQALVNGKDFSNFEPCEDWQLIDEGKRLQLFCADREHSTLPLQLIQKLILDDSYHLLRHKIEIPEAKEIIDVEYLDYSLEGTYSIFHHIKGETSTIDLDMEIKNIKFNVPGPTAIRIPDKFTPIR